MDLIDTNLDAFLAKMEEEGVPDLAIRSFSHYYRQLQHGATGLIGEDAISRVTSLPDFEALEDAYVEWGNEALNETAILKLNGGLGTSMGLKGAKSLLRVREELTFLDIIAKQAIYWNVSLVLMNSFSTVEDSREKIARYEALKKDVPLDFIQHKIPKIDQNTLQPVCWQDAPELEWCPPGHGDIYTALVTTGMLEKLLRAGIRYMFVSNGDNLGAVMDPKLLGYFAKHDLPFLMEVADRTEADRKGGHLALAADGRFVLRESAQCPIQDLNHFQDIARYRFFNTNNLWINLEALDALLQKTDGILGLPMIRNSKTVDPRRHDSTPVYQLETAMGAAISVFEGAGAVRVPRDRFAPVKTTNELLAVQSDAYEMNADYSLSLHPQRKGKPCAVNLDRRIYKKVDDLSRRFPHGPPSLKACDKFQVFGDVYFGNNVTCEGEVTVRNLTDQPHYIESHTVLSGECVVS